MGIRNSVKISFPFYQQPDIMDCGPTCIRMVAKHYGKSYSLPYLRRMSQTTRQGSSMLGMSEKGMQNSTPMNIK